MKHIVLSIVTLVVLLSQLASPIAVRADDETPPAPTEIPVETSTESTPPSSATETATPVPALTDDSAGETPAAEETGTSTPEPETPSESTDPTSDSAEVLTTEQTTVLETAQAIPAETSLVMLDASEQPMPLVAEQALQVIGQSAPVWCPAEQAPTPGANGCTAGYATLAELVAREGWNIAADGTIWVASGAATTEHVLIEGHMYSTWSNYAVTLQGGWSGVSGDTSIDSNTVITSSVIYFTQWNNDVTLNNFTFTNTTSASTSFAAHVDQGNVVINNSEFSNPQGIGAGIYTYNGNIEINNSTFNNNGSDPDDVNTGYGARLITDNGNITVNNSSFNGNADVGLEAAVNVSGTITINNSTFNNNRYVGVQLQSKDQDAENTLNHVTLGENYIGVAIGEGSYTLNQSVFDHNRIALTTNGVIEDDICTVDGTTIIFNDVTFIGDTSFSNPRYNCPVNVLVPSDGTLVPLELPENENTEEVVVPQFSAGCTEQDVYWFTLPSGDVVALSCVQDTVLPAALPSGYTYVSAFALDALGGEASVADLGTNEIEFSFVIPAFQEDSTYSILYWENGAWTSLHEIAVDENGDIQVSDSQDPEKTLNIVSLVLEDDALRIEGTTTFGGVFLLAQH